MRLPFNFGTQVARAFRGAIMQRGDGELVIVNTLQRMMALAMPMEEGNKPAGATQMDGSFAVDNIITANGVSGQQTVNVATLGKGLWRLQLSIQFLSSVLTTNLATFSYVTISPPGITLANSPKVWRVAHVNSGPNISDQLIIDLTCPTDGWVINQNTDATVALDIIAFSLGVIANKIG